MRKRREQYHQLQQQHGIDYDETHAQTMHAEILPYPVFVRFLQSLDLLAYCYAYWSVAFLANFSSIIIQASCCPCLGACYKDKLSGICTMITHSDNASSCISMRLLMN